MGIEPTLSGSAALAPRRFTPIKIENVVITVSKFRQYLIVDERLTKSVAKDYKNTARRFLKFSNGVISRQTIRSYLTTYLKKKPKTYNNQLDRLRAFISRFLTRPYLMHGFKKAHVDYYDYEIELPTKEQLELGFNALAEDRSKAIYLIFATSGLRKSEGLQLTFGDIDFGTRCVKSKHNTRTKKAGITFYNEECEYYLKRYLKSRTDNKPRVFRIDNNRYYQIWNKVSEAANYRITPQVLRVWHSSELGELGVPDRYVDVFQGRAPRSVLAKFYTGKDLLRLKRIYDKAGLQVLS